MNRSSTSPIFILGVHRSGTTLLRYMLSSHPRIYIPPESDFIPYFFLGKPTAPMSDQQIGRALDIIFSRYRFVKEWQGEPPELAAFVEAMPDRTPAAFLHTLYGQYAAQNSAQRWGDKTPIYASYVDLIGAIFPRVKIIHIIRDGRDAAVSMLDKYERDEFHVDVYFSAYNWVRRIRKAQADGARLGPDRFYEMRYEDLVNDPEEELRKVCRFIGEDFDPVMLAQHRLARQRVASDSHFFANVREPVTAAKKGRWQRDLAPRDQRLVQQVQRDLLRELNYPLQDLGPMSPAEQARLAALRLKYLTLQAGRRVLQAAGLFPPI